jgi:histidine ammonia-lyase
MGSIGARKAWQIMRNLEQVNAIEYMTAAQALDFHTPLLPGKGTKAAHDRIRSVVPHLAEDRLLYEDLRRIAQLVEKNVILVDVEHAIGSLE